MKKTVSIFISMLLLTLLYAPIQTNATVIDNFNLYRIPGAPGTGGNISETYVTNHNECELVVANLSNCILVVNSSSLSNSQIVIYSLGNYNLTFGSLLGNNNISVTLNIVPINSNMPSYCNGAFSF